MRNLKPLPIILIVLTLNLSKHHLRRDTMSQGKEKKAKKSFFDNPLLSTKVKSAKAKIFPEGALGYFVGPTLALLSNSILSGYLNKYMTDVLKMTVWAKDFLTWLPIISVIFVVLGNIVVGRLMDHSKTRAGKARPILLLSAVLSVVALIVLFIATPFNTAESPTSIITLVVFAIGYNLWFAVAYPFYYTPHSSLVTLSTRNSTDRSLLATISNATALAAMGLTSMILPFFMGLLFVSNGNDGIDPQKSYNNWRIFVIALMIITFIGTIIEYYFTRERITEESFSLQQGDGDEQKKAVPLSKQAKVCLKDKYWWIIIFFFFLYQLGGMLKNCSQIYYCQSWFSIDGVNYSAAIGGTFQGTLSIIGAIPTAVGMLLVWPLANKIGKGKSILFGAFISVIGGAIGFIDPSNFALVTTSFVIKALGSTPAMYISLALMADMLDHEEAVYGIRTDGLTMTVYGAIMAGMTGIANGIINAVLVAAGYNSGNIMDNIENVRQATLWTFIGGETICYACIAILFFFMNVEKFSKIDHETIVADQKAAAEAKGITYVSAEETLKLQEEESKRMSRENDLNELKARCEKKGLNYENELAAYEAKEAEKAKSAAEKKAYADAKKAEKKAKADAKAKAKLDAMTEEQRHQAELAEKAKKDKALEREMKIEAEFVKLRSKAESFRNSLNA